MNKTLFIVSGGVEAVPGIRRAKEMGLHVAVSDRDPNAPGFALADDKIIADTYGTEETRAAAIKYHKSVRPIDGVICMAADVPMTVASTATALGLPGISLDTARLASDKMAMKKKFVKNGVPVPWFNEVESLTHLQDIVLQKSFPFVLKPVDSRGARGVLLIDETIDIEWAYNHSMSFSPSGRIMIEEYVKGPQISTETVIVNGKPFTSGFADRNYEFIEKFKPHIIENGGQQPSFLNKTDREDVVSLAEKAATAMGIITGIAKGDMVLTPDGPKVIEIAARLSGGWFSSDQIPLSTGVDMMGAAIKIAINETLDEKSLVPEYHRGVAIRYFFPHPGQVKAINIPREIYELEWIYKIDLFVEPGDIIEPVTNHTKRAGYVITTGSTNKEAVERALSVVDSVKIKTHAVHFDFNDTNGGINGFRTN